MQIWNRSKERYQEATEVICPKCRGFGQVAGDGDECSFCEGDGVMWKSATDGYYAPRWMKDPQETIHSKRW